LRGEVDEVRGAEDRERGGGGRRDELAVDEAAARFQPIEHVIVDLHPANVHLLQPRQIEQRRRQRRQRISAQVDLPQRLQTSDLLRQRRQHVVAQVQLAQLRERADLLGQGGDLVVRRAQL